MAKPFETEIDILCPDADNSDQVVAGNQAFSSGGVSVLFSTSATVPTGCAITGESLEVTIAGETFPITAFPQTITLTTGETFEVTGSYASPNVMSTSSIAGNYNVSTLYTVDTDNCGSDSATAAGIISPQLVTAQVDIIDENGAGSIVCPPTFANGASYDYNGNNYTDIASLLAAYQSDLGAGYTVSLNADGCKVDVEYVQGGTPPTDVPVDFINPNPERGISTSTAADQNTVVINTVGSVGPDPANANIEDDPTASYLDIWKDQDGNPLFEVAYAGGGAPTVQNEAAGLTAATIQAAITGTGGSTGYTADKEAIRDHAVTSGVITDGGEWTVCGSVTFGGLTSTNQDFVIKHFFEILDRLAVKSGNLGPFSTFNDARLGMANGFNENGQFSYPAAFVEASAHEVHVEGLQNDSHDTEDPVFVYTGVASQPGVNIDEFDTPLYSSLYSQGNQAGIEAFSNIYNVYNTAADPLSDPAAAESVRIGYGSSTDPWTLDECTGDMAFLPGLEVTTNANSTTFIGDTVTSETYLVERFAEGAGGITISGDADSNNAVNPEDANINGGSAQTYASTDGSFVADASGDYYVKVIMITATGMNLFNIASARVKCI